VNYFRPQQAGKIGPKAVHSFSDSTSLLSQNTGQVKQIRERTKTCLSLGFTPDDRKTKERILESAEML